MGTKPGSGRKNEGLRHVAEQLELHRLQAKGNDAGKLLTIQQQLEAIAAGDFDVVLAQAHPDIELEIYVPPDFPFIPRAKGIDNVREAIVHNFGSVEDQQPVLSNVLTQGDVVVLFGTEHGRVRKTGLPYRVEFVHRFTFDGMALRSVRIIAAQASSERA